MYNTDQKGLGWLQLQHISNHFNDVKFRIPKYQIKQSIFVLDLPGFA